MEQEKKYLKTIEEFEKALDAGKTVYEEVTGIEITKSKSGSFYFADKKRGERYVTLHPFLSSFYKPYILEPKPIEVKLYHLYKDGSGDKFFIGKCSEGISGATEFMGVGQSDGLGFFSKSGKRLHRGDFSCFNLVEEIADLSKFFE